jgi:hypothetical protein
MEVPLNMGVDAADLYPGNEKVTRTNMFDHHFNWARDWRRNRGSQLVFMPRSSACNPGELAPFRGNQ